MPTSERVVKLKSKVWQLRRENPRMKGVEIARIVGVSRERVRQFLGNQNACVPVIKLCPLCGRKTPTNHQKYCSRECWMKSKRVTLTCDVCGENFTLRGSEYRASLRVRKLKMRFCSRKCNGHWLGKNFGVGRRKHYSWIKLARKALFFFRVLTRGSK